MSAGGGLLRTQLLKSLLFPLLLLLVADTFVSYWVALSFAQRAYDVALVDMVREVSLHAHTGTAGTEFDMPEAARKILFTDPVDAVHFEVATSSGQLVAGRRLPPAHERPQNGSREVLYDGILDGVPIRLVEYRLDDRPGTEPRDVVVRVAETKEKRNALAREILLSVVLPQVLLILIASILVWAGVNRGLAPLKRVQQAVALRSHRDRSAVVVEPVPGEVQPLVGAINGLLGRLDVVLTLQERFIADAAHQIKTPLAGMKAQLELAMRDENPKTMRESLGRVDTGLDRLSRLVSQMLTLARNEPGVALRINMLPVDLTALALDSATSFVPEALRKRIDIGFDGTDQPLVVAGDPSRLREMLDNLVDNAVRYTPDGGRVTIRVSNADRPSVSVSDDAPRIPAEERQRIFERFHRRQGTTAAGSGLGLAIALEIVHLHGGDIELLEDDDGVGNTFTVSLPRQVPGRA